MGSGVSVQISTENMERLIDAHIQAAVAESLSHDPEKLIEKVVTQAMSQKEASWSKETLFGANVNRMIRDAAEEALKEWLEANKILLKKAIEKRLKQSPQKFINSVTDQIVEGLGKSFDVSATLRFEE